MLASNDGLIMASSLSSTPGEERVAAMSSALLSIAHKIAKELKRGILRTSLVAGSNGFTLLLPVDTKFLLAAVCSSEAKLGMILFNLKKLGSILSSRFSDSF